MAISAYIRPLSITIVLIILAVISVIMFKTRTDVVGTALPAKQLPDNVDVSLKNAHFSEVEGGRTVWTLNAAKVDYDKKGEVALLTDIKMLFPRGSVQDSVTVTADKGVYTSADKKIILTGHVHLVTDDGADFVTDVVTYSGITALFTTKERVVFHQARMTLVATGMVLNSKIQRARFLSAVESTVALQ